MGIFSFFKSEQVSSNQPESKNISVKKYCENCGIETQNPYYGVLFPIHYLIDGTHNQIQSIDRTNQIINFRSGEKIPYTIEFEPNSFVFSPRHTEHLYCSSVCEDNYLSQFNIGYVKGANPFYPFKQMNVFNAISAPIKNINGIEKQCDYCGIKYKSCGRNYMKVHLHSTAKASGHYNEKPTFDMTKYSLFFSGMSERNPVGDWYFYETDFKKTEKVNYCSCDCAFEVVKKEPVIVLVNSVMDGERLGAVVKETEMFNMLLGNKYIHRASYFKPL